MAEPRPTSYDPLSPDERAPSSPPPAAAVPVAGSASATLQPPLTRRGRGPGLLLVLPADAPAAAERGRLDPPPVQKWAEEGFAVVGVAWRRVVGARGAAEEALRDLGCGIRALRCRADVEGADRMGLVIYDDDAVEALVSLAALPPEIACIVVFTSPSSSSSSPSSSLPEPRPARPVPIYTHIPLTSSRPPSASSAATTSCYPRCSRDFVLPSSDAYDGPAAALAHTRSLVFLRRHLGGPTFDIEAVWEEHTFWEFERRSVARTMATMVAEPYVNHVPTMIGGMGRERLTAFYRDHFIFSNPPDTVLQPLSRTVGPDRIVDEFVFRCTHTAPIPWLLPHVPARGLELAVPMVAVVNVRGDRLAHEHIWWDQASALRQAGVLPTHVPAPAGPAPLMRLPVAGAECARLLADVASEESNGMLDPAWAADERTRLVEM